MCCLSLSLLKPLSWVRLVPGLIASSVKNIAALQTARRSIISNRLQHLCNVYPIVEKCLQEEHEARSSFLERKLKQERPCLPLLPWFDDVAFVCSLQQATPVVSVDHSSTCFDDALLSVWFFFRSASWYLLFDFCLLWTQ